MEGNIRSEGKRKKEEMGGIKERKKMMKKEMKNVMKKGKEIRIREILGKKIKGEGVMIGEKKVLVRNGG